MGFKVYRRNEVEESLRRRNARLGLLADGARQLLSNDRPEQIVQGLCERAMVFLDCHVFSAFLSDPEQSRVHLRAYAGMPREVLEAIGCPFPTTAWECTHRPGCQRSADCRRKPAGTGIPQLSAFGIQAYACHPLVYQGRNIGILSFGTRSRQRFNSEDLDLMRAVADLVAAAVARDRWERELERQVALRTAELERANRELEAFTYAASHDMRAPLGRINSFATLLARRCRDSLDEDGINFLELIQQNAQRLNTLVADLLDHARFGGQPLPLESVEPRTVIQAILMERNEEIREGGVEIRLDLANGINVRSNHLGFAQVMRNLVDNALKYSSRVKDPVVEIGSRAQGDRCRLWVRDNGIGIDMAYKERIFEIFRRLHTYSDYPGSGVGLALVKKAVERMEGKVWVESEPGEGATFYLELPLAPDFGLLAAGMEAGLQEDSLPASC